MWCRWRTSRQPWSPSSLAFSVDPTMSVNRTVDSTRSNDASSSRIWLRNLPTSSTMGSPLAYQCTR
jgi:hypothetical protein